MASLTDSYTGVGGRVWPWTVTEASALGSAVLASEFTEPGLLAGTNPLAPLIGLEGPLNLSNAVALSSETSIKQAEFDRAMDVMDAKQNGVNNFQWNLIRDQFGAVVRELAAMRQEMAGVKGMATKNEIRDAEQVRLIQAMEGQVQNEAASRSQSDEAVLAQFGSFKQGLERDAYARAVRIEENSRNTKVVLEALEVERAERGRWAGALESQTQGALRMLQAALERERTERVQTWEEAARELRAVRGVAEKELHDRTVADEVVQQEVRAAVSALEQERKDRAFLGASLEERCGALHQECAAERDQRLALASLTEQRLRDTQQMLTQERVDREAQNFKEVEATDVLRARLQDEVARLQNQQLQALREYQDAMAEQKNAFDARFQQERVAREQNENAMMQELQRKDAELRREVGRVEAASAAGDVKLNGQLVDLKEAQDQQLRSEVAKIMAEIQAEHARMREGDSLLASQIEQLDRRMKENVQELTAQMQNMEEVLRRDINKVSSDLEGKAASLRLADANLRDHFDRIEREIRQEVGQEKAERQEDDARLAKGAAQLGSALEALDQKLKDNVFELSQRLRTSEQELRAELARNVEALRAADAEQAAKLKQVDEALNAEIERVYRDLAGSLNELRAHAERRYAIIDETMQSEKKVREANDASLLEKLEAYLRQEKDDVAAAAEDRAAIRGELMNLTNATSNQLQAETAGRIEQDSALSARMNALQSSLEREWVAKLSREDFDLEAKRIWEAIDSHTHQVQPPPQPTFIVEERMPTVTTVQAAPQPMMISPMVSPQQMMVSPAPPMMVNGSIAAGQVRTVRTGSFHA